MSILQRVQVLGELVEGKQPLSHAQAFHITNLADEISTIAKLIDRAGRAQVSSLNLAGQLAVHAAQVTPTLSMAYRLANVIFSMESSNWNDVRAGAVDELEEIHETLRIHLINQTRRVSYQLLGGDFTFPALDGNHW